MKKTIITRRVPALLLVLVMLLSLAMTGCELSSNSTTGAGNIGTTNPTEPSANPTEPSTKPTEPSDIPTEPSANPTEPSTNPTEPSAEPTEPGTDPTEPTTPEEKKFYTIIVRGEGGFLLSDVTVVMSDAEGNQAATGVTDDNGEFSIWLQPGKYTVKLENLKTGYTAEEVTVTEDGGVTEVVAKTAVVETDDYKQPNSYAKGDVMWDFVFTKDGEDVELSEVLKTKKLVIINFWATWCGPCKGEFPVIEQIYKMYGDDVEVIALSTSDSAKKCNEFKEENGYTFTMMPDVNLYSRFSGFHGGASIPCTIFIDRYGVIANYMVGGNDELAHWQNEVDFYLSDDYSQTGSAGTVEPTPDVDKPDVEMPDSSDIGAAINGTNTDGSKFDTTFTPSKAETVWPWVITEDGTAIEPSNYGKHNTNAMINFNVTFGEDQFFAFDYKYSIEYDVYGSQIYDAVYVYVDGHIAQKLIVKQNGKTTCYAYAPVEPGTHTITIVYAKDASDGYGFMENGKEYVHINNLRLVSEEAMKEANGSTDVWRPAASVVNDDENATTSYKNYVDVVMGDDGFYHVGSKTGPILLAKLCGSTQWSESSLEEISYMGKLVIHGIDYTPMINADYTRSYCWLEKYSKLGYVVVDQDLAELLQLFATNLGEGKNHDKEWLEFCSYFEHYGVGEGITQIRDVFEGLNEDSAIKAELGDNLANINKVIVPRGFFFAFTPDQTGVYTFYSINEGFTTSSSAGKLDTIAWLYDDQGNVLDSGDNEGGDGNFQVWHTLEAGRTYYIAVGYDPVDDVGQFYFRIEYVAEKMDVMTVCTAGWTTLENDSNTRVIWRNYDFKAALGTDGYYHQILADGSLDYSETGYVYVDMLGLSSTEGASYIPWIGDWCTLQKCIEEGYYIVNDQNKAELVPNAFDFTKRTDGAGNSLEAWGNCQAEMEEYLAQAKAVDQDDPTYGYVKADIRLVEILTNFMSLYGMNKYATDDATGGVPVDDQWLMFCAFMRHV